MAKNDKSTGTSAARKRQGARSALSTQARILDAAKLIFSQCSYDGVGVREIAMAAEVDPALVIRYFGSKEALFEAVASTAFDTDDVLQHGIERLPTDAAEMLTSQLGDYDWSSGYDPLRLLLYSVGSTTAGPIVSRHLRDRFVAPIAGALSGRHRNERAMLLAGSIVGFALVRIALASAEDFPLRHQALKALLAQTLKASADGADDQG